MVVEYKQVILVRQDLNLPKGKCAAQAAHASSEAVLRSMSDSAKKKCVKAWRAVGQKKVVLRVDTLDGLHRYNQEAKDSGLVTALITDAGKTVIAPGTVTALGIGPDDEEKIDKVTGKLKML